MFQTAREYPEIPETITTDKITVRAGSSGGLRVLHGYPDEHSLTNLKDTLVMMAHGFPGHKTGNNDLFGDLEFILVEKGFHTLRFDFGGCGESDGKEENFTIGNAKRDIQNIRRWAQEKGYRHFICIGEGLGATLSVMEADPDVRALILLWPVLDLKYMGAETLKAKNLTREERKKGYIERDGHRISVALLQELEKLNIGSFLKQVRCPTLVMHGARDEVVPVSQLDLARRYINAHRIEITTFHDGSHGLPKLNHRKMMFYHIAQFVEKYA